MSYVVRKAATLSSDEKIALNIVGIPDNWPIEAYAYVDTVPENYVLMTGEELSQLRADNQAAYNTWSSAMINTSTATQKYVEKAIASAIAFGSSLIITYAAENVLLGITQAGKTAEVREKMAEIISALGTGSLYDAIAQAKAIDPADYDSTFITAARLLNFINKIETYLGITLSTEL